MIQSLNFNYYQSSNRIDQQPPFQISTSRNICHGCHHWQRLYTVHLFYQLKFIVVRIQKLFLNYSNTIRMNQIFYVDFGENKRFKDFSVQIIYNRPTFTFSLLIFIQAIFFLHSCLTGNGYHFSNDPLQLKNNFQFYRIFTAPFSTSGTLVDFAWLISSFWWMLSIFPLHEHKFSSIHLMVELFIQNFLLQILYFITVLFLSSIEHTQPGTGFKERYLSMGWDPIVIIWVFMLTGLKKQGKSSLYYLPIQINNESLAWVISLTTLSLGTQRLPIVIGTILGSLQFHILNHSLIKLPLSVYTQIQSSLQFMSKYFNTFIALEQTQDIKMLYNQFETVPPKKAYDIRIHEQIEDLLTFDGPEIKQGGAEEVIKQQIDKWIKKQEDKGIKKQGILNFEQD